ncbi:MAG: phosphoribosylformylglycinamidine synthase subunit PurQ [Treponemataceae bacterium]|nr:phosphoribosylformylglycinamidine synthase subunit PurQ [Treponemataceae bacterium]
MADTPIKRVYVEKRPGFDIEARHLCQDVAHFLGVQYPELTQLQEVRILHRYDVAHLTDEDFHRACSLVFAEPQCDSFFIQERVPHAEGASVFGIEYLPGQYDQRADSAEQCVELAVGVRPRVRCARIFVFRGPQGPLSTEALRAIKRYLINPVDSREAPLELPPTLDETTTEPSDVPEIVGFITMKDDELKAVLSRYELAMSLADLQFCQRYFSSIKRDPTLAELRVLDTYWSDHCRHTTFTTILEEVTFSEGAENEKLQHMWHRYTELRKELYGEAADTRRPPTLMDIATIGARYLKKQGLLQDQEESPEINACSIHVTARFTDGTAEPWLLMFKNETHNHPTEIEPFGGAATCLGGAIRDPLSGRAYVHQAMRISGGGDPRTPLQKTLPGKLPQLKIAREAAAGYSSYGNQIGLATGQVAEFYHPGFLAKRMELGAVIGAAPRAWVRREDPQPGDVVLLVGGKTGRDGIGGATGSSRAHTDSSVETAGAEVQKGNPVEERKLQRLFRNPAVTRMIKRCNDFGAGGVSVAIGELAPGLSIDLDRVPKKYEGLNGIELAISESQERMAVVVAPEQTEPFIQAAAAENLLAVPVATVTAEPCLRMYWQGKTIVDIERSFLDTNGAPRSTRVRVAPPLSEKEEHRVPPGSGSEGQESSPQPASSSTRPGKGPARPDSPQQGAPHTPTAKGPQQSASREQISPSLMGEARHSRGSPLFWDRPEGLLKDQPGTYTARALLDALERELRSLRSGSRRGLQERFDGSIGAASVLFPWGGKEQGTPECGMAALLPSLEKESRTASLFTFGYDPYLAEQSPYEGAKGAIREALAKFACLGGNPWQARLSLQEYFPRCETPEKWGKPLAALLGALEAQLELRVPAIGGKDSMSGTYRDPRNHIELEVPPTLVAFAAGTTDASLVRSGALSGKEENILLLLYQTAENEWECFRKNMDLVQALTAQGAIRAAYPVQAGGVLVSLALMAFGNMTGVEVHAAAALLPDERWYQGSVLLEIDQNAFVRLASAVQSLLEGHPSVKVVGRTLPKALFRLILDTDNEVSLSEEENPERFVAEEPLESLRRAYEYPLLQVYPQTSGGSSAVEPARETEALQLPLWQREKSNQQGPLLSVHPLRGLAPLVVLPVFPGTNCEWDMERAFRRAGARTKQVLFRNRDRQDVVESSRELAAAIREAQILAFSGGFSAGDEPEGSGKFIANALRSPLVREAVLYLLEKQDGLIIGICNGFQALIKVGLLPYGEYRDATAGMPTLTFNRIGRHVSRMVYTKVMSNRSPWLALEPVGTIHTIPVSHGEGRLAVEASMGEALFQAGQVPFCYVDQEGRPTMAEPWNPNGSAFAIEGLTSPDGKILGKMGHSERCGPFVHVNIPGNKEQRIFEAGVRYFAG